MQEKKYWHVSKADVILKGRKGQGGDGHADLDTKVFSVPLTMCLCI